MVFQYINALMSITLQLLYRWEIFSNEQLGILFAFNVLFCIPPFKSQKQEHILIFMKVA